MTEFERKLRSLAPAPADRDALLFASGRASAPSPRWLRRACGLLVATQVVTLGLLLRRDPPPPAPPPPPAVPLPPAGPPDPSSYLALLRAGDVPPAPIAGAIGPDAPPLTAGSRSF